jgi:flagellar biosynthetic protein FliR
MDALLFGILLSGRILPVVFLVPAFGGLRLPVPAKLGLTACLVIAVHPQAGLSGAVPGGLLFYGLWLKELAVGTVLALAGSCLFEGMKMGGELIDNLRGSAGAHAYVPQSSRHTSPLGDLHLLLCILVFFAAGGPALFLKALHTSLADLPVCAFPQIARCAQAADLALVVTAQAVRVGVSIAFPAAVALLVTDLLLGLMNRTAPQIQVFFLGMPLRAVVGILAVILMLEGSIERFVLMLTS